ncbi:MAG: hypothetical protein IPK08_06180 [Bacteroidetes bacterium]|nr:hypothetical protein [Bacteroidota bacterium]
MVDFKVLKDGYDKHLKLRNTFHDFILEKNMDWVIILGSFFGVLPYLTSKNLPFLVIKLLILISILYLIYAYLKNWSKITKRDALIQKIMIELIK